MLEGQPNVTALDLQMKILRDAAIKSITQMATRMREEATDVKATVGDIEDWLDRIRQLAEEVRTGLSHRLQVSLPFKGLHSTPEAQKLMFCCS